MNFENRIYNKEFKLNDTDDSIIEYIRTNRSDIHKISIQKIANDLFISPNAIMRLAKKLGYSGFSELKFSLQSENEPKNHKTITTQIFEKIPNNISRTFDVVDETSVNQMLSCLQEANRIMFAGVDDAVFFCELFGRYLKYSGKKVDYFKHIDDIEDMAEQYKINDLIVIISASGQTESLINIAKSAKTRNVKVISMTHFEENSLNSISDIQISFWGEKRVVNNLNVTDYVGLMMIIRMICEKFWDE